MVESISDQVAQITTRIYPGFWSLKWLGIFLLHPCTRPPYTFSRTKITIIVYNEKYNHTLYCTWVTFCPSLPMPNPPHSTPGNHLWYKCNNNLLLTEREGHSGEYWPEVVAVPTDRAQRDPYRNDSGPIFPSSLSIMALRHVQKQKTHSLWPFPRS